jgi:chemotaxis protein CheD
VNTITVGVGEVQVCRYPNTVLVTHALGSSIAVLVHDPVLRVSGLLNYMLPSSSNASDRFKDRPAMFANTGVPLLFRQMYALACKKSDLVVKVVGGANIHDEEAGSDIGQRNYMMLRKMLWKDGVPIRAEAVGGNVWRTTRLFVDTGQAFVRLSGSLREEEL